MEAAGPSTHSTTNQSTAQLSSKKSPNKNPKRNAIFKQNNNNTSPKRSINNLSSSNNNLQNGQVSFPIKSQNGPSTSTNKSQGEPVPRCIPSNEPFTFSTKTRLNTPKASQENAAVSPSVDSLRITIKNESGGVPPQRVVHNNVIQPQRVIQNDVIQPQMVFKNDAIQPQTTVQNDATAAKPFQFRFPQSRSFVYDPPHQKRSYPKSAQPFVRAPQVQNNENKVNGEPSYQQQQQQPQQQYQQEQPQQRRPQQHQQQQSQRQPQQRQPQQQQQQQQWQYWRQRQRFFNEEQGFDKKVIVTGFPAYTRPEELARKLSVFGAPQVEVFKNRVAVVQFRSDSEAVLAINGNDTIPLYGTILSIFKYTSRKHVLDMVRANRREVRHEHKGPPVAAPTEIDLSGDFSQQMQNIEDAIRLTQEEVDKINLLFEDIEKYMKLIYPTCEAVPFGSITTGQGIKSSDADCFLSLAPGADGRPGEGAAERCSQFVSKAAPVLRAQPHVFAHVVPIPRANTPIIKFLHLTTNVNCDLNSKTPLGVQNSRLVGHLLRGNSRFGAVALLLKYWARVQELSGTGRLTNYALLLLLVFYLQRNLLPPVYTLQGPAYSFIIENWDAGFNNSPLPFLSEVPPLRDLLGGFFLYYDGFDFENLVVCPFMGRPMRKAEFESNVLPEQFALYRRNLKERLSLPVRTNSCLCVQDPFELSHNVASAISYRLALEIKAHIKLAATAYTQEEKSPGDFLRTILLTRPVPPPESLGDARFTTRVSLPARLLQDLDEDWQQTVRHTVLNDIFKDMMFVELTRRDAVSREPDVDLEVYVGNVNRPIWKRNNVHQNQLCSTPRDVLNLHRETTEHIVNSPSIADVTVPFEVELGFRSKPRGLSITTSSLAGADEDAFRSFRQFVHTFVHRWHKELLNPHLRKDPSKSEATSRNDQKNPKKTSPKKARRATERSTEPIRNRQAKPDPNTRSDLDPPMETVAFVNSNHKELCESVAAISIVDSSKQNP